jgi:archaeosine-15-forming tRNA-guanine transglycosylase
LEDEEISPEEEAAVQEARDELAAGAKTVSLDEVTRELE